MPPSIVDDRIHHTPLLSPHDPAPVETARGEGTSPFFLTCEHAGRALPRALGDLGLPAPELQRHIAWDIGAAGVARRLSARLDAALVLQTYSRLVVDCNRAPGAPDHVALRSDGTDVPGNRAAGTAQIAARTREVFHPYHDAIRAALDAREAAGRASVLVSVHSFTPVMNGVQRPWHAGVLYQRDRRLAGIVLDLLAADPGLCVGDNEPYALTDTRDYAVPVHGEQRGIPHVELEIRQDLIATAEGQEAWAARLAGALGEALEKMGSGKYGS